MKNLLFFAFVTFLFTSCNKEALTSTNSAQLEIQTIDNRTSETVEVGCEVSNVEIIIEETVLTLINFDTDIEEMDIASVQTIELLNLTTDGLEEVEFNVLGFEIIIEETVLTLEVPTGSLGNYEVSELQTLTFIEN